MHIIKVLGVIFLSLYLILTGLGISFIVGAHDIVHLFAVVSGVLMLVSVGKCHGSCHDTSCK